MPGLIKPQLATLKSKAPRVSQWIHEVKYDGYRVQVHVNRETVPALLTALSVSRPWLKVKCVTQANSRLSDSLMILQAPGRPPRHSRWRPEWNNAGSSTQAAPTEAC